MTALADSSIIVAGTFQRFFTTEWQTWRQLVRFDNATRSWRPIAVPPQRGGNPVIPAWQGIYSLTHLPDGSIFCGGARMNGILANDTLSPLPGGTDGAVTHGVRLSNGDLVVAGSLEQFDGLATPVFARRSQGQWHAMPGPSLDTVYVYAMAAGPDGSVVVASVEQTATSRPVRLHRWQAGEWERLTPPFTASAVAVLPTGSIVISSASQPRVAILQDNSWNVVAVPGATSLQGLYAPQNGDVYVIDVNGTSPIAEQRTRVLRLDGTTWTQVGTDLNTLDGFAAQVSQLVIYEGTVVLGGTFGVSGVATSVVQLQPTGWKTLGSNLRDVASLVVHPTGELWAAGNHSPPGNLRERSMSVARWTGSHWQAVAPPVRRVPTQQLTLEPSPDPTIAVIVPAADGSVDVVGDFDAVESHGVAGFATLVASTRCDSIDFNNNTVFPEDADVIAFFNVLAGAECAVCNDMDFNNNGVTAEDQDVIDFFNVLAGGTCP
ncbi:MAG TPA: hypothetical protein VK157_02730 [Phycisphaerales bacterium]|nr:hypothetical protein [Phycisphaerales bacterium]